MQCQALADTVDSVTGTTANLHSGAADVVTCLTSLNHLCRVMQKCSLCLDQPMTPTVPQKTNAHTLSSLTHGIYLSLVSFTIAVTHFLNPDT